MDVDRQNMICESLVGGGDDRRKKKMNAKRCVGGCGLVKKENKQCTQEAVGIKCAFGRVGG